MFPRIGFQATMVGLVVFSGFINVLGFTGPLLMRESAL
ncbi:ABC-type protease/lipase transport system fused ATPase/permease subunit [Rhizobium leguminosarum]|uniref:ABC-type protease/lipase transport system fused ATPase/permease subunit n=1 Tax=Rhizobium leguminosarum TaxID=384 RepID=A0AAE2MI34_RHILE|nr:ABC-type protease/lipase transport system fused ATPase/permease subunit [Rhizobium leguminosarum]MBB4430683.1 ABC-type protease/lipase transport system fused ATPase/permease subunit [Rhizobium esperanzae]MBB4296226.1 ABC-type protease/lipase transport system fused ATPase/permease subunit [Rhizobium leguminosarum]MBB4308514.1 ABC-type protease/lipase transport system fused ATPase/permease subunit [Rhizobium leguminosarum]MBB4416350.1 ABC-type protease/lipase transport system fused ATPase/perm